MPAVQDGPASPLFAPLRLGRGTSLGRLGRAGVSAAMATARRHAPSGRCVSWGVPFDVRNVAIVRDRPVSVRVRPTLARWLVFMHTSDVRPVAAGRGGFVAASTGRGRLNELAASYVILYADGSEERVPVRRGREVGPFTRSWGENCFECVPHTKPYPLRPPHEQPGSDWGRKQYRVTAADMKPWVNWLWAWENPHPERKIAGLRFEPVSGALVVSAVSAGRASETPLRWGTRRKALLRLSPGTEFDGRLDERGRLAQIRLDLGQVIAAEPRRLYPDAAWPRTHNNLAPELSRREVLVEYACHPDARFHLPGGRTVPAARLEMAGRAGPLRAVEPATRRVRLRVVEKGSRRPVAVKLHVHGAAGEYLAPVDRHRVPNPAWFEDYSVDFAAGDLLYCTYISGEATVDLPLGRVYIEVSKGFEIRPVRKTVTVRRSTEELVVELEKVLPWRERGWVTADTHVHFLTPQSALLEGAGEGVNVVNLLASQWGELMTNVGDFDGRSTWGSREAGGDGEHLVRVGTENRQHVLGHISLLGYRGGIIAPMTTGGPDESALGDPVGALLTEWARQCRRQGGIVVIPHFPNPRCENAATIAAGLVDGVEMTSWGNLYAGIDPYSLSDWYRFLNCGYAAAAVGGTDKMSGRTAVGTVRTYARVGRGRAFTYGAWMDAVRRAETFVSYGPLMEFSVDGRPAGSRLRLPAGGGTLEVTWEAASVTVPMSRVELVVNGEVREGRAVRPDADRGSWSVKVPRSSWLALLVRGHHRGRPEIIAAHSSPVMVEVKGSPFFAAADALTILEQIEGALAYLDTVGTRAQTAAYRRMRLTLTSIHRRLHNRMHRLGQYHGHAPGNDHHRDRGGKEGE